MNRATWSLLCLAALASSGCGKAGKTVEAKAGPKPVPVTVAPVEVRSIERTVDAVGTLKGWEEVTIGVKKVGRVARVNCDIGDRVKPGQVLVQLQVKDAELAVDQAEKQLLAELAKIGVLLDAVPEKAPTIAEVDLNKLPTVVQAQVALDRARQNLAREKTLMTRNAGLKQDFQNVESDVRGAEAGLENAILTARSTLVTALASKVGLDVVRQNRADLEIRAPVPTRPPFGLKTPLTYAVTRRAVSEGQMLREGDPAFDLVVENPLRLWLNVPERYASEIKAGQEVRVEVSSYPGVAFAGKVSRINPMVDSSSRTFQVEAAIPNDEGKLRPGGFAKAQIITDRNARATVVPLDAIVRFAGVTKLFVAGADGKAHAFAVETGKEGRGWAEILAPLPEGARVVTTGQALLADDTPVAIRVPEAEAKAATESGIGPPGGRGPNPVASTSP